MRKTLLILSLAIFGLFAVLSANEKIVKNALKERVTNTTDANENFYVNLDLPTYFSLNGFQGGVIWWETFETPFTWSKWTSEDQTFPRPEQGPPHWVVDSWEALGDSSWRMADLTLGTYGGYDNHWYQVLDTPPILLDEDATFTFHHRYSCESPGGAPAPYDSWDGMNVRISTDDGETWQVLPSSTYNCSSLWSFGHPDQGHNEGPGIPGWAGEQNSWLMESFDLSDYTSAETPVMLRFAFASDLAYSTGDGAPDLFGWQIDSIEVKSASKMFFANYGTTEDLVGKSNEFIPPAGGDLWHVVKFVEPLPAYYPEATPNGNHAIACQNGGYLYCPDSTYNPYMDNIIYTGPISLPDATPIYLDYKYVPNFYDSDDFPNVEFFRPEVRNSDSTEWEWIEDQPYVYSLGFDNWLEFGWTYGYPTNMTMFDLSRFAGQNIDLCFRFWSDYDEPVGPGLLIDDVVIYSPVKTIPPPENVTAEASPADTSIIVTWDEMQDRIIYTVWRMGQGQSSYYFLDEITGDIKYIDNNIEPFYEYKYVVTATVKYFGRSDISNVASASVIPEGVVEVSYDDSESDGYFDPGKNKMTAVKFTPSSYPVEFSTIKIHLDATEYDQGKGKFYVYDEDSQSGLPGTEIGYKKISSGLVPSFNIVTFDESIIINSGSFFIAYKRYTKSMHISIDTDSPIDGRTYYEDADGNWAQVDSFDAIIHVFINFSNSNSLDVVMGIEDEIDVIADKFLLYKNFPNPFNPATKISFSVPEDAVDNNINLDIFNVLGQRVITLFNGKAKAGINTVQWNGNNESGKMVNSGIYIYRLQSGKVTLNKRMLLIK
jgi:hypothetical protein